MHAENFIVAWNLELLNLDDESYSVTPFSLRVEGGEAFSSGEKVRKIY